MLRLMFAMLLGASLVSSVAATTPAPDRTAALARYQRDLVSILVLRSDASHLLGAALLARPLSNLPAGIDAASLLQRAAKADGHGPAVTWMQLTVCGEDIGPCPNPDALAQLHAQAPENAAVWLLDLDNAARDGDHAAELAALEHAASARNYDDYAGPALQSLVAAATALPVPKDALAAYAGSTAAGPASAQAFLAFSLAALHPRPGLLPLVGLCSKATRDDDPARGACLRLARTLAWGSSPQARAAGLRIQQELADNDAQRDAARDALRDLAWQVGNYSRLALRALTDQPLAVQMLRLAQHGGSEASQMNALLHQHGIALVAPAGTAEAAAASSTQAPAAPASSASPAEPATARSAADAATPADASSTP